MRTWLRAATLTAVIALPAAAQDGAGWTPVADAEVLQWARDGSSWCLNPDGRGGCVMVYQWRRQTNEPFTEVAALPIGDGGGMLIMAHPFELAGGTQCYTVDPEAVRYSRGMNPDPALADAAEQRWRANEESDRGNRLCATFWRDEAGRVRRRMTRNGAAFDHDPGEWWTVEVNNTSRDGPMDASPQAAAKP